MMWVWTCFLLLQSVQAWTMISTTKCIIAGQSIIGSSSTMRKSRLHCVKNYNDIEEPNDPNERRRFIEKSIMAITSTTPMVLLLGTSEPAEAVSTNNGKPTEFVSVGTQAPPPEGTNPFVTLENGVKYKDIKIGTGDATVTSNSRVDIQCSGRLLNLNGVSFYNTKNNNPDGFGAIPLTIDLGKGQAVPGLESGLLGMKKAGVRRIIGKFFLVF